ncbi:YqaJ viral recombinase domain [Elysia marginata]|uniref:YqaJ viral recombinase domain n=1 Tax=Elysia marginata TaxID=1093978 RepID=A0AAV4G8U7_9GAST|nr:YqaJ viral recombinase domain [Elysia marginata]
MASSGHGKDFHVLSTKEYNTDYIGKYKTEKAYAYFKSNFVGTVSWAEVPNDTERCFLTSEVTPSQGVRADPHKLWVLLNNTGEVLTSVCSCTAGMCHTCNHVIAVLYKVEYAIRNNLHSKSCTETSCQWNKGTRKEVKPKKIQDMDLRSDKAARKSLSAEARQDNKNLKLAYDPRRQAERFKTSAQVSSFLSGLKQLAPHCALFTGLAAQVKTNESGQILSTLPQLAERCLNLNKNMDEHKLSQKFGESLLFTKEQCETLEKSCRQQSSSSLWQEHRKGRITGSNVRRVVRKVEEKIRNKNTGITSLAYHLVSGGQDLSHVPTIHDPVG